MPLYIHNSAYFETLKNHIKIKNGNVTLYIQGLKTVAPFSHIRIDDQDVKVRHPKAKGPDAQTAKKLAKEMAEKEKLKTSQNQSTTQQEPKQTNATQTAVQAKAQIPKPAPTQSSSSLPPMKKKKERIRIK